MIGLTVLLSLPVIIVRQILFGQPTYAVIRETELSAINDSSHSLHLYLRVRNDDPPSELDPAFTNATVRRRICDVLTNGEFFEKRFLDGIDMQKVRRELRHPRYSHLRRQIYRPTRSRNLLKRLLHPHEYANPYTELGFEVVAPSDMVQRQVSEHVFVCLTRSWITDDIFPYYVSKEYNVFGEPYMAGRFLFGKGMELHGPSTYDHVLLAEEPANAYTRSDYDVELHYLETRMNRQPAENNDLDPICRIIPPSFSDNQSYRLCVKILRSAHFRDTIAYPIGWLNFRCHRKEVSFRTEEAQRRAAGGSYFELMLRCDSVKKDSLGSVSFYISRSYRPNQVFVYTKSIDHAEGGIERVYLETLFTNVAVADDPVGFDDVE